MDPKEEPELRDLDEDQDAEDGVPVGQDETPEVREDSVAEFEPVPENDPAIEGDSSNEEKE